MKIVYIGTSDGLAETLIMRMRQEGHDVYLLSDKEILRKPKDILGYRFYRTPRKSENFQKLLQSILPDCIIFAGNHYIDSSCEEAADEDVTLLAQSLRTAVKLSQVKFILLSSIEVYGNTAERVDEQKERAAASERGIRFVREELLLEFYRKQYSMDAVILRGSHLYTNQPKEDGNDFLSQIYFDAAAQRKEPRRNVVFLPLHVSDFVDAVKRVMESGKEQIYNVCASTAISAESLNKLICHQENFPRQDVLWEEAENTTLADNTRIKQELGWNDIRNLEGQLCGGEITYKKSTVKNEEKKNWTIPTRIRQTIENMLIFGVFFALHSRCSSNALFAQIDWLMIYVILASVAYNAYQSILASVLASIAYLYSRNMSVLEMNNFYSYAGGVLAIAEFVSMGLIVSYTISIFREKILSVDLDLKMLKEEHEELKVINEENVLIKNEYENRLLSSKTGFPKLYSLVSRLMVEEPDRIFMETMAVISELVHTDTVAVYRMEANSPYLRLLNARNEASAMNGKTWNLSDFPRIYDAVVQGELYQGEPISKEPAIVLPIVCHDVTQAVILIKTLPYESDTLYHVNLLKTMSLLLRDCVEKALQYEKLARAEQYIENTEILKAEAFHKRVLLAKEKAEKNLAEYCEAELLYSGAMEDAASTVASMIRTTDYLGTDGEGKLFALLNNTGVGDLEYLQKRLVSCDIQVVSRMS